MSVTGAFSDCSGFGALCVVVTSTPSATTAVVAVAWSEDGTTTLGTETLGVATVGYGSPTPLMFIVPAKAAFCKVLVFNASGGAVPFSVVTFFRPVTVGAPITADLIDWSAVAIPASYALAQALASAHVFPLTRYTDGAIVKPALDQGGAHYAHVIGMARSVPTGTGVDGQLYEPQVDLQGGRYVHQRSGVIEGRTVKQALLDADITNGPKVIVAAVAGKSIRVIGYMISESGGGAGTYKFTDGSGGTVINPGIALGATSTVSEHASTGNYLFQTTAGNALAVNSNVATARSIRVNYIEV